MNSLISAGFHHFQQFFLTNYCHSRPKCVPEKSWLLRLFIHSTVYWITTAFYAFFIFPKSMHKWKWFAEKPHSSKSFQRGAHVRVFPQTMEFFRYLCFRCGSSSSPSMAFFISALGRDRKKNVENHFPVDNKYLKDKTWHRHTFRPPSPTPSLFRFLCHA